MLFCRHILVLTLGLQSCVLSAVAAEDLVATRLDKARQQFEESIKEVKEKVLAFLYQREETAKKAGNLELQQQIAESRTSFQKTGVMADGIPVAYYRQSRSAYEAYEKACQTAAKAYTQEGRTAEAKRVAAMEDKLAEISRLHATRFEGNVRITSTQEVGYDLGSINRDDRIRLTYVSGKWKGWGNIASDSPDDVMLEKGNRNRLVVCEADAEGRTRVLSVVPAGTRHRPFELVANRNYDRIVLRINDNDGEFENNPDEKVTYHLQIVRGK